jgi:hypothetical protein
VLRRGLALLMVGLSIPACARTWNAKTDWGATGNGRTDDYRAIQRGVVRMASGDTVIFPSPGTYYVASTVNFSVGGIRVKCESGASLAAPNNGTDIFANIKSNTAIGGSAATGCIFNGGGIQAYGAGGDSPQSPDQAVANLVFSYNTFQNMTYSPNDNFRTNGAIFLGGGSNNVVIRYNTFSNIMPYDSGYNAAPKEYMKQYDPDGDAARAAIWFYGASNLIIDHNTFLHDYQNIKGCQGQLYRASNILIHHNFSDSHHRMFLEINSGTGCGNLPGNAGIATFQVYDNYVVNAGGAHPYSLTFGFSAPFQETPVSGMVWYNNLLKGTSFPWENTGIGMEAGGENMNIHNNTIMSQWYCAGCAFGRSTGGYMQNNYACITVPSHYNNAAFMEEHGPNTTTVTIRGNTAAGPCPVGLRSLAVSLGPVTNTSGTLSATANVTTVEYGMQGVVFAIDGHYVSAVMGGGPYKLSYGAAGLPSGAHTVAATVVDAVGLLAESNKQNVLTTSGVGSSGPIGPDVDPSRQDFDIAGNTNDPINGRRATQPVETGRR